MVEDMGEISADLGPMRRMFKLPQMGRSNELD